MIVSLIAAMSENRVIGKDGRVPWHLPADMRHFKRLTLDHAVIMGRKTFDTLPRPLERRRNIVVTRSAAYDAPGTIVVHDLAAAFRAAADDAEEVFVAGGEEIYRATLPRADRLYLTVVHTTSAGDTFFPEIDFSEWKLTNEERHSRDDRHQFAFTFRRYDRKSGATKSKNTIA